MFGIAIQPDNQYLMSGRYQSFSSRWAELAQQGGHEVRLLDASVTYPLAHIADCDGFMWWFARLP